MSTEEELELKDMVAQTLETNGCLPKIMAQLRANIFLALDEDLKISKQQPLLNIKLKNFLDLPEGQLMFCLVREFLEYFDLDCTASVYESESYLGKFYKYEGREKIQQDLGMGNNFSGPLLLHLVKILQTKTKTLQIDLTHLNNSTENDTINGHSEENNKKWNATYVSKAAENDDTFNGTRSIEEENLSNKTNDEDLNGSELDTSDIKLKSHKNEKVKSKLDLQMSKSRGNDILPSLYCKELKDKASKEYDFEIKDDYEEDFMSGTELDLSQSNMDSIKPPLMDLTSNSLDIKSDSEIETHLSHSN